MVNSPDRTKDKEDLLPVLIDQEMAKVELAQTVLEIVGPDKMLGRPRTHR